MATRTYQPRNLALVAILLVLALGAVFSFRNAGRWLIHEDALTHADVILVLSGSMPYRAEEAATVYRQGYAPEIWLTHPASPRAELQSMGIHYESDEDYDTAVLTKSGVPAARVRVLPEEIEDTSEELQEAGGEMKREGKSVVIIVTSVEHTRRVGILWHKFFGANPKAIVHGAPQDGFDANHWWRNTRDALSVEREYLGLLNAWTGLHVRPYR